MLTKLGQALGDWAPSTAGGPRDPVVLLAAGWAEIVGEEVARNSHPSRIADDTLFVTTRSSSWSQQLSYLSDRIVQAVRARFPALPVAEMRFRVGAIPARAAAASGPGRRSATAAAAQRLGDAPGREPPADATEALARLRASIEGRRRAKTAQGWNHCTRCGALVAPGEALLCVTCDNARAHETAAAAARLIYEAPWLGYAGTAELVEGLTRAQYESVRASLLSRWWDTLERAAAAGHLSRDGRERSIASSYVVLRSKLPPEEISPATVRNELGDAVHDLIYGTETQTKTNVE